MITQSSPIVRLYRFVAFCVALTLLAQPLAAWASSGEHVKSAFLFAGRQDWKNARLHAKQSGDAVLLKLMTWEYLLDSDSGASFEEIVRFVIANPTWPEQKRLRIRAELSLRDNKASDDDLIAWFGSDLPLTGVGKMALVEALLRKGNTPEDKIAYLVRDAWRNGDFDEDEEKDILDHYGKMLRAEDDIGRIDRLLWEGKVSVARRILDRVPSAQQKLFSSRMALIEDKRGAIKTVSQVPSVLKMDAGLLYDRIRYYVRQDDDKAVRELLLDMPDHVPYPDKWWKLREIQVRQAVDEGNYPMASKLLAGHEQLEGQDFADATWLKGWLMLEFLKAPGAAYNVFEHMYDNVKYPVSKSRAAYWAARAAEQSGDEQGAKTWYANAAVNPTAFYGQMAILKLSGEVPLHIPAAPAISAVDKKEFEQNDIAHAVILCVEADEVDLASKLLSLMIENETNPAIIVQAVEMGNRIGKPHLSVRGAKKALQQNVLLVEAGFPTPKTPSGLPVERALALGITRQESEFDPQAKSASGAIGMMQLLPRTAKEVAKRIAMGFANVRLHEPSYNITIGSHYLARLLNAYDGSYVMAIAAYNAGPGNVRKWAQQFGTPGKNIDAAVDWIEKIPFPETRNYVQRVLENVQVYRHIESGGTVPLKLDEDLVR